MILLASRLGLRASDITRLQFASLNWDNNVIILKQHKTKREIILPLLSDIGDAIIDYIKNGRQIMIPRICFCHLFNLIDL